MKGSVLRDIKGKRGLRRIPIFILSGVFVSFSIGSSGADKIPQSIEINLNRCEVEGRVSLYWGLGSVMVSAFNKEDDECVFKVMNETEGGFTLRECRVSVSDEPIVIKAGSEMDAGDYGRREGILYENLDIDACPIVGTGNLLMEE